MITNKFCGDHAIPAHPPSPGSCNPRTTVGERLGQLRDGDLDLDQPASARVKGVLSPDP